MAKKLKNSLTSQQRISVVALFIVMVCLAGFGIYIKFFSNAATVTGTQFEAETMSVPPTIGVHHFFFQNDDDQTASGGRVKKIYDSSYSASKTIELTQPTVSLIVTARKESIGYTTNECLPQMRVRVDGYWLSIPVKETWKAYKLNLNLEPGTHTLKIGMNVRAFCNQTLVIDKVAFEGNPVAASNRLYLSSDSQTANVGDSFDATVLVDSAQNIDAVQASLTYPTNLLEVSSVSEAFEPFEVKAENSFGNGAITIVRGSVPPPVIGNGQMLARITFKARSPGVATVRFTDGSKLASAGEALPVATDEATYTIVSR